MTSDFVTRHGRISWGRAAGLASVAVYGPFLVMAIYTSLFVACAHCKAAVWKILPCGPGLIPFEAGRRWLDLPRFDAALGYALLVAASLGMTLLVAILARRGTRVRWVSLATCLVAFSLGAVGVLALVRA